MRLKYGSWLAVHPYRCYRTRVEISDWFSPCPAIFASDVGYIVYFRFVYLIIRVAEYQLSVLPAVIRGVLPILRRLGDLGWTGEPNNSGSHLLGLGWKQLPAAPLNDLRSQVDFCDEILLLAM